MTVPYLLGFNEKINQYLSLVTTKLCIFLRNRNWTFDQSVQYCLRKAYQDLFPELTDEWGDDFANKCPVSDHCLRRWETNLKTYGSINKTRFEKNRKIRQGLV